MRISWVEWWNKLSLVGYPDALSLDEQSLTQLMFRHTTKRNHLISWLATKIAETIGSSQTDHLRIFSSFVYGSKDTLAGFIEGTISKNVMENIFNSILNDLRPMNLISVDNEVLESILYSNSKMLSPQQFELLGIKNSSQATSPQQPEILDIVDEITKRADAVLAKNATAVTAPSEQLTRSSGNSIRSLARLNMDAEKLVRKIKTEHSIKVPTETRIEVVADLHELAVGITTTYSALKKLNSSEIEIPLNSTEK